ncbi:MAG TPA: DUF4350 domain-containing protein [Kofleriaceae bacterium]
MKRALVIAMFVVGALLVRNVAHAAPQPADPETDYDPYSQAWNGMASFVGLAEGMGFTVDPMTSVDWSELTSEDILFLVWPLKTVDATKLGAFVTAGGNVVIADDFGTAHAAMQAMGLLRAEVAQARATRFYQGLPYAPIANSRGTHEIAQEVGDVVTNHPAVMTRVEGAEVVVALDQGAIVAAGERGSGRFVAVSDPSIFINRMLQFPGNVRLTANILNWLDRGNRRARHIKLLRGDVLMSGDPLPFIDDPNASQVARTIASLNFWLSEASVWLLTETAMKILAYVLAAALLGLAILALPVRRGPRIDGAWLRFHRPVRRDEPSALVTSADGSHSGATNLVLACILRDHVQRLLGDLTHKAEPLYTVPEAQLVAELGKVKGPSAGTALARVYKRLRALPSRGQAAAPWSAGHLARREFDALYKDVSELCRTLGADLLAVEPA